ncbi:PKD domain-containing protein [Methanococcoides methylutens]|uniref:Cell surface protein n=1 Tax=Methanococcoides methylutens MM1 TaxID=1434104 RepID=A0A0E3SSY8_METMT|nr:PKD domain-containing protein [Methanococcoides methylutens]AKB85773.1 cell surface protein [Methanococcoides methylutens MM1]
MNSLIKPVGSLALVVLLLSGLTSFSTNSPELVPEPTNDVPETNHSEWDNSTPETSEFNISVKEGDKEDPGIWVSPGDHKPKVIVEEPAPPVANFTAYPLSGVVPLNVTFNDSSSDAEEYSWDVDGDGLEDSNASDFVYRYDKEGIYNVSLIVTNKDGSHTKVVENCINVTANPSLSIVKLTDGYDVDDPSSYEVEVGSPIVWSYNISNKGDVPLTNIFVNDSVEGPVGVIAYLGVGEYNDSLNLSNTSVEGVYQNAVTASTTYDDVEVNSTDVSYYFGVNASIDIESSIGDPVSDVQIQCLVFEWTYNVTNNGNVDLTEVVVQDNSSSISIDRITVDADNILEPNESWVYSASATTEHGWNEVILANVTAYYNGTEKNFYAFDEVLFHYVGGT